MEKKRKAKTVKERAWAVVVFNDFVSHLTSKDLIDARAVFGDSGEARRFLKQFDSQGLSEQEPSIVECTITYKLPKEITK